jgi:hypothetical protein
LTHLERMTDDTGLLEHALGDIPKRREGYTTDDNARALWVCASWYRLLRSDPSVDPNLLKRLIRLADVYLAFLVWAQEPDGHFYNNYSYDRQKEPESPSDDCLGRTLWSCAVALRALPGDDRKHVLRILLSRGFKAAHQVRHMHGGAYILAAAALGNLSEAAAGLIDRFESELINLFRNNADDDWQWFDAAITYSGGLMPWALYRSFVVTGNREARRVARASLDFLTQKMIGPNGHLRPIGNDGWCTRTKRAIWDQQPVDIAALALAAEAADRAEPDNDRWYKTIGKCRDWFHGENDLQASMFTSEGGGYDGFSGFGVNRNQGAESTLSYLLTELIFARRKDRIKQPV